jgi:hypothetical protein
MAIEDNLNAARAAFVFYDAYMNAVAQEMGMEKALALHTKVCENLGPFQGQMLKGQTHIKDFDAKAAYSMVKTVPETLGIATEVLEESPQKVRFKCKQCSVYEAAMLVGLDQKTREAICRNGSIVFMDKVLKQLNPKLSYRLVKYRSSADDFCEEAIVSG